MIAVLGFAVPTAIGAGQKKSNRAPTATVDGGNAANIHITIKNTSTAARRHGPATLPTTFTATTSPASWRPGQRRRAITSIATTVAGANPYIEVIDAAIARNKTYTITINAKTPCSEGGKTYPFTRTSASRTTSTARTTRSRASPRIRRRPYLGLRLHDGLLHPAGERGVWRRHHQHRLRSVRPNVAVTVMTHGNVAAKWFAGAITLASQPASTWPWLGRRDVQRERRLDGWRRSAR